MLGSLGDGRSACRTPSYLGLGVSIGGLFSPLLGLVADAHGPHGVLVVLLAVPPAAALTSLMLRDPAAMQREPTAGPS